MLKQLAKIIDAGGPLRVKYCTNASLWVVLAHNQTVIETYKEHDKAEDECERMNNEIVARNVVKAIRKPTEIMIEAGNKASYDNSYVEPKAYTAMIDAVLT